MKAAVVEAVGRLAVRDVPEPAVGEYEARCEMLYGAVCAGTDTHLVHLHPPFNKWLQPPFILGHESIGRVTGTGAKVRHLRAGDCITRVGCPPTGGVGSGWGGFAQVGIATDWRAMQEDGIKGWDAFTVQQILPADVDPADATLFITWRETLSYITRMGVGPGCSVLVIGSGGNGLAFAAHARHLGAEQITIVGSPDRTATGTLAGASLYADYRKADCWEQVGAAEPGGYDFVIDSVGKAEMTAKGQAGLKPGGSLGIYGMDENGRISLSPGKTFTYYGGGYKEAEAHDRVLQAYRTGQLNPAVWLDRKRVFALDEITDALQAVADRSLVKPLVRLNTP